MATGCSLGRGGALIIAAAKAGDEGDLVLAGGPRAGPGLRTRLRLRAVLDNAVQWKKKKQRRSG